MVWSKYLDYLNCETCIFHLMPCHYSYFPLPGLHLQGEDCLAAILVLLASLVILNLVLLSFSFLFTKDKHVGYPAFKTVWKYAYFKNYIVHSSVKGFWNKVPKCLFSSRWWLEELIKGTLHFDINLDWKVNLDPP